MSVFETIGVLTKNRKENGLWRKRNPHNSTKRNSKFDVNKVTVGNYTYGGISVLDNNLYIGNFCSIASEVLFILAGKHRMDCVSTYPFKVKCLGLAENETKGDIIVDDDVWIGQRATIMSGVHIGQEAVIASNAVVTKNVPPYAICAGNPGKIVRYRFFNEIIEKLLKVDFGKIDKKYVMEHIESLYKPINDNTDLSYLPIDHDRENKQPNEELCE